MAPVVTNTHYCLFYKPWGLNLLNPKSPSQRSLIGVPTDQSGLRGQWCEVIFSTRSQAQDVLNRIPTFLSGDLSEGGYHGNRWTSGKLCALSSTWNTLSTCFFSRFPFAKLPALLLRKPVLSVTAYVDTRARSRAKQPGAVQQIITKTNLWRICFWPGRQKLTHGTLKEKKVLTNTQTYYIQPDKHLPLGAKRVFLFRFGKKMFSSAILLPISGSSAVS